MQHLVHKLQSDKHSNRHNSCYNLQEHGFGGTSSIRSDTTAAAEAAEVSASERLTPEEQQQRQQVACLSPLTLTYLSDVLDHVTTMVEDMETLEDQVCHKLQHMSLQLLFSYPPPRPLLPFGMLPPHCPVSVVKPVCSWHCARMPPPPCRPQPTFPSLSAPLPHIPVSLAIPRLLPSTVLPYPPTPRPQPPPPSLAPTPLSSLQSPVSPLACAPISPPPAARPLAFSNVFALVNTYTRSSMSSLS